MSAPGAEMRRHYGRVVTRKSRQKAKVKGKSQNRWRPKSKPGAVATGKSGTPSEQTKVESVNASGTVTGTIGEYFYDGDGRRVKKIAYANNQPTETKVFIYDASSRLVAEYSTILNPTPQVAYLTNDHLGSPRINTNALGAVISRHDYRPYGEGINERTHLDYVGDTIRKQFTSYERDIESELDYAQARYYNSKHGRFTTTDPILMTKERKFNPQEINLYAYVRNNPLAC